MQSEKCFLTCIYHFQNQIHDELYDFCTKFDLLLSSINPESPLCSIVTGDFNAHCCSRWWQNDITNSAQQEIEYLALRAGSKQSTYKPTHVVNNYVMH